MPLLLGSAGACLSFSQRCWTRLKSSWTWRRLDGYSNVEGVVCRRSWIFSAEHIRVVGDRGLLTRFFKLFPKNVYIRLLKKIDKSQIAFFALLYRSWSCVKSSHIKPNDQYFESNSTESTACLMPGFSQFAKFSSCFTKLFLLFMQLNVITLFPIFKKSPNPYISKSYS